MWQQQSQFQVSSLEAAGALELARYVHNSTHFCAMLILLHLPTFQATSAIRLAQNSRHCQLHTPELNDTHHYPSGRHVPHPFMDGVPGVPEKKVVVFHSTSTRGQLMLHPSPPVMDASLLRLMISLVHRLTTEMGKPLEMDKFSTGTTTGLDMGQNLGNNQVFTSQEWMEGSSGMFI